MSESKAGGSEVRDKIIQIGRSTIQHGPDSNRVYLMKLDPSDLPGLVARLDDLADRHGYTKLFAKVPVSCEEPFLRNGYRREGFIPRFYSGTTGAAFLGRFIDPRREATAQRDRIEQIAAVAQAKVGAPLKPLPPGCSIRLATEADAPELARVYRQVFASYPFPISDPAYLIDTLQSHVCYSIVEKEGRIVAAASGEMDRENKNAEMTDFATLPDHLGCGMAAQLLRFMEPEMARRGILTLYTIARAVSAGMNITFAKCGYLFGGTLIHNTQISGSIESMNLWYRQAPLSDCLSAPVSG